MVSPLNPMPGDERFLDLDQFAPTLVPILEPVPHADVAGVREAYTRRFAKNTFLLLDLEHRTPGSRIILELLLTTGTVEAERAEDIHWFLRHVERNHPVDTLFFDDVIGRAHEPTQLMIGLQGMAEAVDEIKGNQIFREKVWRTQKLAYYLGMVVSGHQPSQDLPDDM